MNPVVQEIYCRQLWASNLLTSMKLFVKDTVPANTECLQFHPFKY